MGVLYLAALIVGFGTVAVQLVGAGDPDAGADAGGADAHADGGGDAGHGHGSDSSVLATFLSLRFWTFSLMGFGLAGTLLHFLSLAGETAALLTSIGVGLVTGSAASWAFRVLLRSTTSSAIEAGGAVGRVGRVLVPSCRGGRAKIRVEIGGQMIDYLATADDDLAAGDRVLVVEVRGEGVQVSKALAADLGGDREP